MATETVKLANFINPQPCSEQEVRNNFGRIQQAFALLDQLLQIQITDNTTIGYTFISNVTFEGTVTINNNTYITNIYLTNGDKLCIDVCATPAAIRIGIVDDEENQRTQMENNRRAYEFANRRYDEYRQQLELEEEAGVLTVVDTPV